MTNTEIAHFVGLSLSSVHERVRKLTEGGGIRGAHLEVDRGRLGLGLKALLFVQLAEPEKTNLTHFIREVLGIPEMRGAWMISGRFDAVIELATSDTEHLHAVVVEKFSSRGEIHRIETSIIFEGGRQTDLSAVLNMEP